ncbi:MAG: hypothetical protein A2Y25_07890 [Candidatus Melainabacteria bacterium GWF2_37_15]|nr:MAG: hypothetical protein A2Y25_07890 [Candidatus Melainabacteria bacterium GWF2_37_15]
MLVGLNNTPHNKQSKPGNKPNFGNAAFLSTINNGVTRGFQFLQENPAIEISAIDATTMIIPRTTCDYQQNPVYGLETLARESLAAIPNPFLPGIISWWMLKNSGHKGLYANSTTLNSLHEAWKVAEKSNPAASKRDKIQKYWETIIEKITAVVGKDDKVKLDPNSESYKQFIKSITDTTYKGYEIGNNKSHKAFLNSTYDAGKLFIDSTGASERLTVGKIGKTGEEFGTSIRMLLRDGAEAVHQVFKEPDAEGTIKKLSKLSYKRAAYGIIPSIVLGASLQKIITGVSKLITGKEGFTGYKDFTKENNNNGKKEKETGLLGKKIVAIAGMAGMVLLTTGAIGKKDILSVQGIKSFAKNFEIKDKYAHIDILRVIYGSVLIGRFSQARDEAELKTSTIRDYSGFMNWLVLGPFVAKGAATMFAPDLLNGTINKKDGVFKMIKSWLSDVSLKAPDEAVAWAKKLPGKEEITKGKWNGFRALGLSWSLFAIGIGMPLFLNKYIIDKAGKKHSYKPETKQSNSFGSFIQKNPPSLLTTAMKKSGIQLPGLNVS